MNYTTCLLLIATLVTGSISAQSHASSSLQHELYLSKKSYSELNVTELVLNNGMRVLLKPTHDEDDELQISLFAKGGYSSFHLADQTIAEAAVATGWECGFGELTIDQQSVVIYENSIEFSPKIEANYRMIEGSVPKDSLDDYLQLVKVYFAEQNFCEKEFDRALKLRSARQEEEAKEALTKLKKAIPATHSNITKKVSSNDQLITARDLFQKSFNNPSEFVCVIVGDFSPEKIEKSLNKYLGTIAIPEKTFQWTRPEAVALTANTVHKVVHARDRNDCIVRMIFPLDRKMKPETMPLFKIACKLVEKRLNSIDSSLSINVRDELPSYPDLDTAWMIIQFRCPCKAADGLIAKVTAEVDHLYQEGPLPAEVDEQVHTQKINQSRWRNSNEFWLSSLTSYALWDASLELILDNSLDEKYVFEDVKNFLQRSIRADRYTTVLLIP